MIKIYFHYILEYKRQGLHRRAEPARRDIAESRQGDTEPVLSEL